MTTLTSYREFIASKQTRHTASGFDVVDSQLNPILFDWQKRIVSWACRMGRAALFEECGLGKTFQASEWMKHVSTHTGKKCIYFVPLAVAHQAVSEAAKLGIIAEYCRSQAEADQSSATIIVINYEMMDAFNADAFGGVALDESSILKSFTGMTKRKLLDKFRNTQYKLACTATPSPNDHMELGNHAEFLGVMPSNEMLMRWFINDTMKSGSYRIKKHAESDFWQWVASWAVGISKPSDIGGNDAGYDLPALELIDTVVGVDHTRAQENGMLFVGGKLSATGMWKERAATLKDRCSSLAEIVNREPNEYWALWCDTDSEADELQRLFPEAIEVRGSHTIKRKEDGLKAFSNGEVKIIITKPDIAGFGLNWQHCARVGFVGVSYSFERTYQALRRFWRFGQSRSVHVHMVYAESEGNIKTALKAKQLAHAEMQVKLSSAMKSSGLLVDQRKALIGYNPTKSMKIPAWLYAH